MNRWQLLPADGPPDPAAIAELFARYDTEIVEMHS